MTLTAFTYTVIGVSSLGQILKSSHSGLSLFFQEMYLNTVLSFDVASAFSSLRAQASPEIAKLHLFHDCTSTEESLLIE